MGDYYSLYLVIECFSEEDMFEYCKSFQEKYNLDEDDVYCIQDEWECEMILPYEYNVGVYIKKEKAEEIGVFMTKEKERELITSFFGLNIVKKRKEKLNKLDENN